MYCIRMKCHINFDPGGKNSLLISLVFLIVGILRFNEVQCSTATGDERWQRRQEFPEASHAPVRYLDSAFHSALTDSPSKMNFRNYKNLNSISVQTKDQLLQLNPDEPTRHSEHHAIKSLSYLINVWRKLLNKSMTSDLAADIPLLKKEFIGGSQRTKSFQNEDGIDELKLRGREEKLESFIGNKPSSIHEFAIEEGDNLSWSHQSRDSILNVGRDEHRQLHKRETDNETQNETESATLSTKNLPAKDTQVGPDASIKSTSSKGNKQTSIGTTQKSTATSRTSTAAQTTTQKPKSSSPSISSTVKQHITTPPQKTSPTAHLQQPPKPTPFKKKTVQTPTSHIQGTEESPTTDAAIGESNAACESAQCYASRLPYHWTTDASWALASMVFLMSVLTFFVLYTGLWKKRNPMSYPLDSSQPPSPNPKINIADLLKTRLAMIPRHLRSKRPVNKKRMNGRRYEELPLHQSNGTCNDEELDYFEDDEDDLYLRDEHTV